MHYHSILKKSFYILFLCVLSVKICLASDIKQPIGIISLKGKPALELKLNNFDGKPYDLANSRGHWVFVHFWASWCGPCRREMPKIQIMSFMLKDTSLEVLLVNTAENEDTVFSFMGIVAPEIIPLMDYDGLVTKRWQPRGLPSTFLIDPEGKQRYLALGGRDWDAPQYIDFLKKLTQHP